MSDQFFEEEEFQSQITGKIFTRIFSLTKPHWRYLAGFILAVLFTSIIDAVFTFISKQVIDQGIVKQDPQALTSYLTLYGALILIQAGLVFIFIYLVGLLGERVRYDLRQTMFNHLQDLSLSYYSKTPVGWIMSRVTSDSDRVGNLVTWGILDTTWAVVNILTSLIFMFIIKWQLALIIFVIVPVLVYVAIQFRKHILKEFREVRKTNSKIVGSYNENITGVRVVKALGREGENMREFGELTSRMYRSSFRAAWLSALFLPTV
ncbi:MAG: ABC transporter transmembrane domain-containing protein, partial [Anaerolineaceae bacterium]